MKKQLLKMSAIMMSAAVLSGCGTNPADNKVNLLTGYSNLTTYVTLSEYSSFSALVEAESNFVIVITNSGCSCTTDFYPILNQYISEEGVMIYTLEDSLIKYETEHYGLPISTADTPIIGIYKDGTLAFYKSYVTGNATKNKPFTDFAAFKAWFEERVVLPTFIYISKAELDAKFAADDKFIVYYGRPSCPDCTYAAKTFYKSYATAHPDMKKIYALDVEGEGLWNSTDRNNTPGWVTFKDNYGLSNVVNVALGYATGYVPTFQYIEANGNLPGVDMSIIKDMSVIYNDSYEAPGDGSHPYQITRSYYDGTRTFAYTDANILGQYLSVPAEGTTDMHPSWAIYHEPIITAFFDMYMALVD